MKLAPTTPGIAFENVLVPTDLSQSLADRGTRVAGDSTALRATRLPRQLHRSRALLYTVRNGPL